MRGENHIAIQRTHLGDSSDHVVDQTTNRSQAGNMFPAALPHCQKDLRRLSLNHSDIHIDMSDILGQCSAGPSDGDLTRFDGDINAFGDFELFGFEDVPHLERKLVS